MPSAAVISFSGPHTLPRIFARGALSFAPYRIPDKSLYFTVFASSHDGIKGHARNAGGHHDPDGVHALAAQHQKRRVPEKVLFLLSALGGSVGMYLGMFTFRHKTKHWYFVIGIPAIILLQAGLLLYFLR